MIERIYERESRGAIQGASVVKSGGDSNGCLVDIRDTKIYFSHGYMLGLDIRGLASGVSLCTHQERRANITAITDLGSKETKLLVVGEG